jgi:lipoprotein-anchoring transpeptidase ErfK/SrfK
MSSRARSARLVRRSLVGSTVLLTALVGGCSIIEGDGSGPLSGDGDDSSGTEQVENRPEVRLSANLPARAGATVPVDTLLEVSARQGTLRNVEFTARGGQVVPGDLDGQKTRWTATERLEPGTAYVVKAVGVDSDGQTRRMERSFRTDALTLDEQTYASIAPVDGEAVGVGMPVVVSFDIPVSDRAAIERHLSVETAPVQKGSWHWISDTEVHWRPKSYWKPGTEVTVNADINGVDAGEGIYGQEDRETSFTVGDAVIMDIDVNAHTMKVSRNGEVLRTLPISAGKPGFTTRSGVKVIVEKFRTKTMDAATTGISEDDPEYYNIENVEYAQRVTYSGEFLHAAPWSVGSQGSANVSHGCVGMSTADAAWLYSLTKRGDVVDVTGSDRPMELSNGLGDWNLSFAEYREGSAL